MTLTQKSWFIVGIIFSTIWLLARLIFILSKKEDQKYQKKFYLSILKKIKRFYNKIIDKIFVFSENRITPSIQHVQTVLSEKGTDLEYLEISESDQKILESITSITPRNSFKKGNLTFFFGENKNGAQALYVIYSSRKTKHGARTIYKKPDDKFLITLFGKKLQSANKNETEQLFKILNLVSTLCLLDPN